MSGPPFKKRFEDSSPPTTKALRKFIESKVDYSAEAKGNIICFLSFYNASIRLPPLNAYPEEFKHWYNLAVVDVDMKNDLQRCKAINWCRTAKTLYPIKTKGDGNCLLHAVSKAAWGIEDDELLLRRMLYVALATDPRKLFHKRWLLHQRDMFMQRPSDFNPQFDTNDWTREWENVLKAANDNPENRNGLSFECLEGIHVYALANVMRRPIIILADRTARSVYGHSMQENRLSGIYLPLEWSKDRISKNPIIIGYNLNHFAPLVPHQTVPDGRVVDGEYVVPLVSPEYETLSLQYLLGHEEEIAHDLMQQYMKIKNIPFTRSNGVDEIPVVCLEDTPIHDHLDIVRKHREECEQIFTMWRDRELQTAPTIPQENENLAFQNHIMQPLQATNDIYANNEIRIVTSNSLPLQEPEVERSGECITSGCTLYGSPDYGGMCSECFRRYTIDHQHTRLMEPSAPPVSMPTHQSYDLSIMTENCRNNCGNKCSTKTYPFCHECKDKEIQPPHPTPPNNIGIPSSLNIETNPFNRVGENSIHRSIPTENETQQEAVDERTLFGEGRNTFGRQKSDQPTSDFRSPVSSSSSSSTCSSPNCEKQVIGGTGNRCTVCYIKNNLSPEFSLSESSEEPSSQTYIMTMGRAKHPPEIAGLPPNRQGLYLQGQPMSSSGMPFAGAPNSARQDKQPNLGQSLSTSGMPHEGVTHLVRQGQQNLGQIAPPSGLPNAGTPNYTRQEHLQPVISGKDGHCRTAGCKNFGFDHQQNMCNECWAKENSGLVSTETGLPISGSKKDKKLCSTPGCHGIRVDNPGGLCLSCLTGIGTIPMGVAPPPDSTIESKTPMPTRELPKDVVVTSSKDKVRCASPLCGNLIYPPKQLCDSCTSILQRNYAEEPEETPRSRSLEIYRESPVRHGAAYSPSRRKCIGKGGKCDYYGDSKFKGYCSKCYKESKSLSAPQARVNQQQPVIRTYNSTQHHKCVEPNCDKYGDPKHALQMHRTFSRSPTKTYSPYFWLQTFTIGN
ncbi:hypothetical protein FSP39_014886 [Pinctada imbricata]|uniref:OTU domain-containing protein n=1 Tax=Pinctada imbricata TaxID=66713 RepID=A0AA88YJD3_PINIB|nr:hypothetical protein FSP39_014886 [Pinctada imbricata]